MAKLEKMFRKFEDDYLEFDKVENKRSNRSDINAFLLLDQLLPGDRAMVCAAEHDEIYLDVDVKKLARVITEEQVLELVRCGIRYNDDTDSLCMFV